MAGVLVSLPIYDIEVYYDTQENPQVRSSIMKLVHSSDSNTFKTAVSGIHALILGHYLSGLNLLSPEYLEGVKAAVKALYKQLGSTSNGSHTVHGLSDEAMKTHPLAALAGKFSGSEWTETWEAIERNHDQLNAVEDLAG
jgi:hypothetical protein